MITNEILQNDSERQRLMQPVEYHAGIEAEETLTLVKEYLLSAEQKEMHVRELRGMQDFQACYAEWQSFQKFETFVSKICKSAPNNEMLYSGYCEMCGQQENFLLDYQGAEQTPQGPVINWNERLVCPSCWCNNRSRMWLRHMKKRAAMNENALVCEQQSIIWNWAKHYFGDKLASCTVVDSFTEQKLDEQSYTVQNLQKLQYEDQAFDNIYAYDLYDTVEDVEAAFQEAARVLRPGGRLVLHLPLEANSEESRVRVVRENGELVYKTAPWRRDNSSEGAPTLLVWQAYGWDLLKTIKACGFRDAYAVAYYSIDDGNLGYLPFYLEAIR